MRSGLRTVLVLWLGGWLASCGERRKDCPECSTVVIAATGEPSTLIPPLVSETVARDISDQIYERLAYLSPGGSPVEQSAYRPGLAEHWERIDSLNWRFRLRPNARWQDGPAGPGGGRGLLVRCLQRLDPCLWCPELSGRQGQGDGGGLDDGAGRVHGALTGAAVRCHLSRPRPAEACLGFNPAEALGGRHQPLPSGREWALPDSELEPRQLPDACRGYGMGGQRTLDSAGNLALRAPIPTPR